MSRKHITLRGATLLVGLMAVAAACGSERKPSPGLAHELEDRSVSAERDSLLREVAENSKLLTDIEAELAKVRKPAAATPENSELHVTLTDRELVLTHVREAAARLKAVEKNLATSERRVRRLTGERDSLRTVLTRADSTVADLSTILVSQRALVTSLTFQVEALLGENAVLADSVLRLTDRQRTAYFVVGSRKELLQKGVVVEEGPRSVPLVGRRAVAPARDLPLQEFTSIDRSQVQEIPLPDSTRKYRIVSRQDIAHLVPEVRYENGIRGSIRIDSPEEFWQPSAFLIVMAE